MFEYHSYMPPCLVAMAFIYLSKFWYNHLLFLVFYPLLVTHTYKSLEWVAREVQRSVPGSLHLVTAGVLRPDPAPTVAIHPDNGWNSFYVAVAPVALSATWRCASTQRTLTNGVEVQTAAVTERLWGCFWTSYVTVILFDLNFHELLCVCVCVTVRVFFNRVWIRSRAPHRCVQCVDCTARLAETKLPDAPDVFRYFSVAFSLHLNRSSIYILKNYICCIEGPHIYHNSWLSRSSFPNEHKFDLYFWKVHSAKNISSLFIFEKFILQKSINIERAKILVQPVRTHDKSVPPNHLHVNCKVHAARIAKLAYVNFLSKAATADFRAKHVRVQIYGESL
jgi:hypothetical protein